MKQTFNVTGMTCSACSAHVEKAVNKLEAVSKAEVSLMTNSMSVEYNSDALSPQDIIYAVEQAGYGASLPQKDKSTPLPDPNSQLAQELSAMKRRLIWSFVFSVILFGYLLAFDGLQNGDAYRLVGRWSQCCPRRSRVKVVEQIIECIQGYACRSARRINSAEPPVPHWILSVIHGSPHEFLFNQGSARG